MTEKLYYKIGEVAKIFHVNTSLIRYWESQFDFIKPKKTQNGIRLFSQKDLDHFQIVYHLVKEKGMTIQGAKDYLEAKKEQGEINKLGVINTLKRTRELLAGIRNMLENNEETATPEDI